jgi:hypothetical protein
LLKSRSDVTWPPRGNSTRWRADLEPQLRGQRPAHPIGGFRRAGSRGVLRKRRLFARRDPESPLPAARVAPLEPPAYRDFAAVYREKANVFQAMRPLKRDDVVRGHYAGYRKEPGVAQNSDVETFCALRLFIDSWRWAGVPWYLRSGKYLADTATEIVVELKPPPQKLFADSAQAAGQLSALPVVPQRRHRPGRSREARREGIRRGAARALFVRRTAGRGSALRAAFGRRDGRRRSALHPRGRGGGRLDGGQKRLTRSSLQTAVGTTPNPRRHPLNRHALSG